MKELFDCVAAGNVDDLEKFIDKLLLEEKDETKEEDNSLGDLLNAPNWDRGGRTIFLEAIVHNNDQIVKSLLDKLGSTFLDFNAKDNQGCTALHYAIKGKQWKLAKLLLEQDIDANAKDNLLGRTPLHAMVASIHTDIADSGDRCGSIIEVFKMLVDKSDVNLPCNSTKDGVLHRLVTKSQVPRSILEIVLSAPGCDINLQNETGETPLMVALEKNNTTHAKLLIEFGADLFIANKHRETSVHITCRKNQLEVLRLMLATRITPLSNGDWDGNTPLHYAASRGFFEAVQMLVHLAEAPINLKNFYGETPLHLAVEGGFTDIIELLIEEEDCDLEARTNSHDNVLDIAKFDYRKDMHPTISRILSKAMQNKRNSNKYHTTK